MTTVRLPEPDPQLSNRLHAEHRIEIPVVGADRDQVRISTAGYTTRDEIDRLLSALAR
jgi:selenocysteine lyase/cysteine desulfurase